MRNCNNVYSIIMTVIKLRSAKWAGTCRTHGSNNVYKVSVGEHVEGTLLWRPKCSVLRI